MSRIFLTSPMRSNEKVLSWSLLNVRFIILLTGRPAFHLNRLQLQTQQPLSSNKTSIKTTSSSFYAFFTPGNILYLTLSLPDWATDKMPPNVPCLQLGTPCFEIQGNPCIMRGHDGNVLVRTSAQCLASTSEWGPLPDSVCSDLLSPEPDQWLVALY